MLIHVGWYVFLEFSHATIARVGARAYTIFWSSYMHTNTMEVVMTAGDLIHAKFQWKSSPPTNQHPTFYRPDALSVAQPTMSEH